MDNVGWVSRDHGHCVADRQDREENRNGLRVCIALCCCKWKHFQNKKIFQGWFFKKKYCLFSYAFCFNATWTGHFWRSCYSSYEGCRPESSKLLMYTLQRSTPPFLDLWALELALEWQDLEQFSPQILLRFSWSPQCRALWLCTWRFPYCLQLPVCYFHTKQKERNSLTTKLIPQENRFRIKRTTSGLPTQNNHWEILSGFALWLFILYTRRFFFVVKLWTKSNLSIKFTFLNDLILECQRSLKYARRYFTKWSLNFYLNIEKLTMHNSIFNFKSTNHPAGEVAYFIPEWSNCNLLIEIYFCAIFNVKKRFLSR